jgi:hypothetical protein
MVAIDLVKLVYVRRAKANETRMRGLTQPIAN